MPASRVPRPSPALLVAVVGVAALALSAIPAPAASAETAAVPAGDSVTGPSRSYYDRCRDRVRTGRAWPIGRPAAIESSLRMLITHTDVITTSQRAFLAQRDAYIAAGIGPWAKPTQNAFEATYCGRKVLLERHILLTTNTDETYLEDGVSYFEIMRDVSAEPTFFNDFAATHPDGFVYQGMVPADPTMSLDELFEALRRQRIPIIMHWPQPGPDGLTLHTLIIRMGDVYAEVVYVPRVT